MLLSLTNCARFGLLGHNVSAEEVELLAECAGIGPVRKDASGTLLFDPVALRQAAVELCGCLRDHEGPTTSMLRRTPGRELTSCGQCAAPRDAYRSIEPGTF